MGSIITLLTDFGDRDGYVGQMKGVILSIDPHARLVDISHGVPAFSITLASLILKSSVKYFSPGAIHLVVVDPGVGSARRPIAAHAGGHYFVGPDNGVFWPSFQERPDWSIRDLTRSPFINGNAHPTFHGRDIFAPVAAHISKGIDFNELGPPLDDPVKSEIPPPEIRPWGLIGRIIHIDNFGNLMTNIDLYSLNRNISGITAGKTSLTGVKNYFSEAPEGSPIAIINSFGFLEIAVNRGRADHALQLQEGVEVVVQWD